MSNRVASMEDLIRRGDVVRYIRDNISLDTFMKRTLNKADEACWDLCDKLNFVPKVEERPTGKWELFDNIGRLHRYECSICGHQISCVPSCLVNYKGCYCGAKMDGGRE